MFLLCGTTDGAHLRTCTATARQALKHHDKMRRDGIAPVVTDFAGRRLSLMDLQRRAEPVNHARHI